MSAAFTKLFNSLLDSTLWVEQPAHVKLVWIAMMAMADRDGFVAASIPGLARRAVVTTREAEEALQVFLSPDPYSRTPDHEGRRVRAVMGGWELLNHAKYRKRASEEMRRERTAEGMRRLRAVRSGDTQGVPPFDSQSVTDAHLSASASGSDLDLPDPEQAPSQPQEPAPPPAPEPEVIRVDPRKGRFAPKEFTPTDAHRVRCQELRFDVDELVRAFKNHEFNREFSDWDRRFSRWIEDEKLKRETEAGRQSTRSSGTRVRFPAELNEEPRWSVRHILGDQRAYAEKHEIGDVEQLGRRFLKERTGPPLLVLEGEREFWSWLRGQRKGKRA